MHPECGTESQHSTYYLFAYSVRQSYRADFNSLGFAENPRRKNITLLGIVPEEVVTENIDGSYYYPHQYWFHMRPFIGPVRLPPSTILPEIQLRVLQPRVDFGVLKSWVRHCRKRHRCHSMLPQAFKPALHHLRLINCETRQIVPAKPNNKYVSLSYVWGKSGPEERRSITQLPKRAPRVIEDAVEAVLGLGFIYLWVDRYCINLDDPHEKHQQIANMDVVYRNSTVTIIAAAGSDPDYGLTGVSHRLRTPPIPVCVGDHCLLPVPPDPSQLLEKSKWMTRAWVYQEAIFSKRRLIFTDDQVYFDCSRMGCRETVDTSPEVRENTEHGLGKSIFPVLGRFPSDIFLHIQNYSRRELSYESDVLNAMLGFFRSYELAFQNPQFYHFWGLPLISSALVKSSASDACSKQLTAGLLYSLQWHSLESSRRRTRFPSWSWTGWLGQVSWSRWLHSTIVSDPDILISVEIKDDDGVRKEDFERIQFHTGQHLNQSPYLYLDAWVVGIRFEYLPKGPPLDWESRPLGGRRCGGEGFYVQTRIDGSRYSSLELQVNPGEDKNMSQKLISESWDCIIVSYDIILDRLPIMLVCDWTGNTATRIGILDMSIGVESGVGKPENLQFAKRWCTDIRLE